MQIKHLSPEAHKILRALFELADTAQDPEEFSRSHFEELALDVANEFNKLQERLSFLEACLQAPQKPQDGRG